MFQQNQNLPIISRKAQAKRQKQKGLKVWILTVILVLIIATNFFQRRDNNKPSAPAATTTTKIRSSSSSSDTMAFRLYSPAFEHGQPIPALYTRKDGENRSPPLRWSGVPAPGTKSLALIVDDPDAPNPDAPKRTWVHWVVYNIPSTATGLEEGTTTSLLPGDAKAALNDFQMTEYDGPSPPIGTHRYYFTLYALDEVLEGLEPLGNNKAALLEAMQGHILGQAELMGTFHKQMT